MSAKVAYRWYDSGEPHDSFEYFHDNETWTYGYHVFNTGHMIVSRIERVKSEDSHWPKVETVKIYGSLGYLNVSGEDFGENPLSWAYKDMNNVPLQEPNFETWKSNDAQ
ncbi:hypothetical protein [Glutamicibacter sp. BSL13]